MKERAISQTFDCASGRSPAGELTTTFSPRLLVINDRSTFRPFGTDYSILDKHRRKGKLFPKIRELLNSSELEELGAELEAAKHQRQRKAS